MRLRLLCGDPVLIDVLQSALTTLGWIVEPADSVPRSARDPLLVAMSDSAPLHDPAAAGSFSLSVVLAGTRLTRPLLLAGLRFGAGASVDLDQYIGTAAAQIHRLLLRPPSPADRAATIARLAAIESEARRFDTLSDRECVVLTQLLAGRAAAEIASLHSVSMATVRSQIQAILTKLQVTSQPAAVAMAHRACRDLRIDLHQFR